MGWLSFLQSSDSRAIYFLAVTSYIWLFSSRENENFKLKTFFRKLGIFFDSIVFMILSKDSKGLSSKKKKANTVEDPNMLLKADPPITEKTIIFIRHGESDWNNVFNKGMNLGIFKRLFLALIEEFKMLLSMDSKFVDSPLNQEGIEQALELRKFIHSQAPQPGLTPFGVKALAAMRGVGDSSVVVTSCLRRAVSTTTIALWPRVDNNGDKIIVLSSLQEISRNIDTVSISAPKTVADLPFSRLTPHCTFKDGKPFTVDSVFDATEHYGTKKRNFYGIRRLKAFNEWVFQRKENVIIVGGHSLWFKYFFQTFMPLDADHPAKNKKITNSGVVAFKFSRAENGPDGMPIYRIAPETITTVYGGFTSK